MPGHHNKKLHYLYGKTGYLFGFCRPFQCRFDLYRVDPASRPSIRSDPLLLMIVFLQFYKLVIIISRAEAPASLISRHPWFTFQTSAA